VGPGDAFEPARKPLVAKDETGQGAGEFPHGWVISSGRTMASNSSPVR
jgi:hypothetical protein